MAGSAGLAAWLSTLDAEELEALLRDQIRWALPIDRNPEARAD